MNIIPVGGIGGRKSLQWFNVNAYGGQASATDSTAGFQAAWNAALANKGGMVYVPPGNYSQLSTVTVDVDNTAVGIWLDPGAVIYYYGSGDCLRMYDDSAYGSRDFGTQPGIFGLGIIDGTHSSASAASAGVHLGDIFQASIYCTIQNFANHAGSINLHLDNQYYWTEQLRGDVYLINGSQLCVFDQTPVGANVTGSFDRLNLQVRVDGDAGQDLVVFQNGTYSLEPKLSILGNTVPSSGANSSAVLRLSTKTPAGSADTSTYPYLQAPILFIGVECDGSNGFTHPPYTIHMDAPNGIGNTSNYIYNGTGVLSFDPVEGSPAFQATNGDNACIIFWGPIEGDSVIQITTTTNPVNMGAGFNATGGYLNGVVVNNYLAWTNQLSAPSYVNGFPQEYAKHDGYKAYISGNANDQDSYDCGRLTRFLTGSDSISSVTPATITDGTNSLSASVGIATYRVRALIPYSSAAAAGTPVLAFTGPATSLCAFTSWFQNSTTTLIVPANNTSLTATLTGPTLTSASDMVLRIDGIVTFSAAGTLALTAAEGTSGDAWTVLAGAFLELEPVG